MRWTISKKLTLGFGTILAFTCTLGAGVFWQLRHSNDLLDVAVPSVEAAKGIQSELHHALSMHRGYMILGLDALAEERLQAWDQIHEYQASLREYSAHWGDEASVNALHDLTGVLQELRANQDIIASVAHTPEDLPAKNLFFTEASPLGDRITETLTSILHLERDEEATPDRKLLVERLAEAKGHFLKTKAAVIAYLASGTEATLATFTENAKECAASVERLTGMTDLLTAEQRALFDSYIADRDAFLATTLKAVDIRGSAGWCVSEDVCLNGVTPLAGQASDLAATIATNQTDVRDAGIAAFKESRAGLLTFVSVGALLAIGVGSALAFTIARSISSGLSAVNTRARGIASRDLTGAPLAMTRSDEIGDLGRSVDAMQGSLTELISSVKNSANEVSSDVEGLSKTSEEIADRARRQSAEVGQIASSAMEMASSVAEVAEKAAHGSGEADEAGRIAEEGGTTVRATMSTMDEIVEAVRLSSGCVNELGDRSQEIGEIVTVINDIADQTNLLALNAAIEAARAGEHGRGFAVVADEVRSLADRTTQATQEISTAIKTIQDRTVEAVGRMEAGTSKVDDGAARVREAGESLERIVGTSRSISSIVSAIAAAASQQTAAADEVGRAAETIAGNAETTKGACEASAGAISSLSEKANGLRALTDEFQV